ncbi:hypothetical protein SLS62_005830 [Diatrype stigma]|uniref:RRM domain-containing protein n=1 Tax=Diatrype stigma TaxID=117547 RepID=A0AAN9UZV9_9PEZI
MTSASNSRKANANSTTNGVSQESTSQAPPDGSKTGKTKAPITGKKVVVRRLPPGITAEEAWNILGDEWKDGNGRVDWSQFQTGTVSHELVPAPSPINVRNQQANMPSSSPSFPSQPARCYLHVVKTDDIIHLSDLVQRSTWEDAKRTMNDSALVGPPYVEIAQFQKIPTAKKRTDPRQGTIDQDPEFQAFLQSLTQPTPTKDAENEQVSEESAPDDTKVTTTPLVQYLKEKRANKVKEAANAKSSKHTRHESQSGKSKAAAEDPKKKGKDSKADKSDKSGEKEKDKPKEPVKLLTKKAAAQEAAEAAKAVAAQTAAAKSAEESAQPKSRRAGIAAAAKLLQRDLGLSPGSAHRRARQDAAKAEAAAKVDPGKDSKDSKEPKESKETKEAKETKESASTASVADASASSAPQSTPTAPKAPAGESSRRSRNKASKQNTPKDDAKGKGNEASGTTAKPLPQPTPIILKRKENATSSTPAGSTTSTTASAPPTPTPPTGPKAAAGKSTSKSAAPPSQKKGQPQPAITAGATRAFVKHANPSQGITETALKQSMEAFGTVTFVEIDKRKGFAYVDFTKHDALVKAAAASPISVAQGSVQVLERKDIKKAAAPPQQQQNTSEKEKEKDKASTTEGQTQTQTQTQTQAQAERPKRGGRGRGRKGGGGGGAQKDAGSTAAAASGEAAASSSKTAPTASKDTPSSTAPS